MPRADTATMAEETPEATQDTASSTADVPEGVATPVEDVTPAAPVDVPAEAPPEPVAAQTPEPSASSAPATSQPATTSDVVKAPDTLQAYIDKAHDTIQNEVDVKELGVFLRAHIKRFREEWETWSDSARETYVHMLTAELLQRNAAATQIALGNPFKLPDPSAHTRLMTSIQHSQIKPHKRYPAIDLPKKLRGITF